MALSGESMSHQLEWLIRTDTQYSGDKLFVQRQEDKTIMIETINNLGNRSAVICRKILEAICYGNTVKTPSLIIDDKNREEYYKLLMALYSTERKYIDLQRNIGIAASSQQGNYKGRRKIKIDTLAAQEIFLDYELKKITSTDAAQKLGISKRTFLRRYKEYAETRQ